MAQHQMREVWITDAAAVTSLGEDLDSTWKAVLAGQTTGRWAELRTLTGRVVRVPIAPAMCQVLKDIPLEVSSVRAERLTKEVARQMLCSVRLGPADLRRTAVVFGSSKPAVCTWFVKRVLKLDISPDPAAEMFLHLPDYPTHPTWDTFTQQHGAHVVSQVLGTEGPILSSISACSTGLHSIIRAVQWLEGGEGEIVFAGAVESALNPLFASSFQRMRVLADGCEDASRACRPFDVDRCGFVIGEGAGAVVVETPNHAQARGARPLAAIVGYARGADPTGLADMDSQGRPLAGVIRRCLASAQVRPDEVACIKAHGTATRQNDVAESAAIRAAFGQNGPPVFSLKGYLGHCLGASGAIEAAICVRAIAAGIAPATANLSSPDPGCLVNLVRRFAPVFGQGRPYMLCLSAGFGGHLAAVLLRMA